MATWINIADPMRVVAAVAAFGLVLALWFAFMLVLRMRQSAREQKVQRRLEMGQGDEAGQRVLRLWHDGKEVTTTVPERPRRSLIRRMERRLQDAGWDGPLHAVALGVAGVTALVFVLGYTLAGHWLAGTAGAAGLLMILWAYLQRRITRRVSLFENQLVDALELASRSLRAGHPIIGAFRLMSEEIAPPVGTVFLRICQQQALGISLERAVEQAAADSASPDMKLFATSVIIQLRSGGNLAQTMERLAAVVRDRIRLNRRVRVLVAQTQFSKQVLIALPLVMFALLNVINPRYMQPLYSTTTGQILLAVSGGGVLMGAYVMNKMAVLRM